MHVPDTGETSGMSSQEPLTVLRTLAGGLDGVIKQAETVQIWMEVRGQWPGSVLSCCIVRSLSPAGLGLNHLQGPCLLGSL